MGFLQKILGSISGNVAEVTATNDLQVRPPTTLANIGYNALAGRSDPGGAGTARIRPYWSTVNNRMPVSHVTYLWDDTFNATTQNINKYNYRITTMAMVQAAGQLQTNSGLITTLNTDCSLQTWRTFPLFGNSELRVIFSGGFGAANTHTANNTLELGLMTATLPGRAIPLDGVFFRWNASVELRGVINYNGTEVQTAAITPPANNVMHDWMILISNGVVEFWIDNEFRAALSLPTDAPGQGQPFQQATLPLTIRQYQTTAPATAMRFLVTDVFVVQNGPALIKPWSEQKSGMGHMAYQGQNGNAAPGTSANALNAATPAASALTNTAISTGSPVGLGGLAHVLPTLTVGTDGLLYSFQNPQGSVSQTPRNLVIKGVTIAGGVDAALTGGPLVLAFSLAYGHTAASLATADTGSFVNNTAKAPRRIWIGVLNCAVTAAAGTALTGTCTAKFDAPITVAPGEFVAIAVRNQGVVTSVGSIITTCTFDAYYE